MHALFYLFIFSIFASEQPDLSFFRAYEKMQTGHLRKSANVAFAFLYGYGTDVRIVPGFSALPEQTDPESFMAPYFIKLDGVSDEELFRIVTEEAEGLSIPAMRIRAFMLCHGRGCRKNTAEAFSLWQEAAKRNDPVSLAFLASLPSPDNAVTGKTSARLQKTIGKYRNGFRFYQPVLTQDENDPDAVFPAPDEPVSRFLLRCVQLWRDGKKVVILIKGL